MRIKNLMLAAAAVCMTASPVLAANPASKLSVAPHSARASAEKGSSEFLGGTALIVALVVAAVIVIVVVSDGGSDSP